jgi:hypothetical protein
MAGLQRYCSHQRGSDSETCNSAVAAKFVKVFTPERDTLADVDSSDEEALLLLAVAEDDDRRFLHYYYYYYYYVTIAVRPIVTVIIIITICIRTCN